MQDCLNVGDFFALKSKLFQIIIFGTTDTEKCSANRYWIPVALAKICFPWIVLNCAKLLLY